MGAEPWQYFVPFESNVEGALAKLREREFRAGRFNGAQFNPGTIAEAMEAGDADGTCSILDIERIGDEPDFGVIAPLDDERLRDIFGTTKPTRAMIEENDDFFENIERGQGVYIVAYKNGKPDEICFAGYSYD